MVRNEEAPISQQPVGNIHAHDSFTDLRGLRLRGGTGGTGPCDCCVIWCVGLGSLCCPCCCDR